jgi:hypothetical protein
LFSPEIDTARNTRNLICLIAHQMAVVKMSIRVHDEVFASKADLTPSQHDWLSFISLNIVHK